MGVELSEDLILLSVFAWSLLITVFLCPFLRFSTGCAHLLFLFIFLYIYIFLWLMLRHLTRKSHCAALATCMLSNWGKTKLNSIQSNSKLKWKVKIQVKFYGIFGAHSFHSCLMPKWQHLVIDDAIKPRHWFHCRLKRGTFERIGDQLGATTCNLCLYNN